jgi:lipopolysaccharide cholinephosphotransferase
MNFDQLFPDEREKGLTRLKQCQIVMLRMLKVFDYLCMKHDIKYFLTGGSLLGAIRHHGFIPWDDDLDVGMTRDNYEKFLQLAVPQIPDDIFFQTSETDIHLPSCGRVEARFRDKYSSYIRKEENRDRTWHHGLMLDIFVYDKAYLPHNAFIYALNRSLEIFFWKVGKNNKGNIKRAKVLKFISKYAPLPLVYASSFVISKKMIKLGQCYKTPKELSKVIKVKFEDMEAYIPIGWKTYLKRMYGNYMQLPPVEKQRGHHSEELPDPFTPCEHTEVLNWKNKRVGHDPALN